MGCLKRCGLAIAALVAATGAILAFIVWHASAWLGADDIPVKADAILVLGAEPTRATTGAELYQHGFANVVYLSVPRRESRWVALAQDGIGWPWFEETARVLLRNRGVPDAAIRLLGKDLPSTVAEAAEAARTFGASAGTLLVVTSRYHVYRARLIFREALPATKVLVVASSAEPLPERWWTDQEAARNVTLELMKLAYYRLGMSFK
jgi:uncharacterized SAM-binding protein YcdF (DUF218 family)